jgi:hypothetical protein
MNERIKQLYVQAIQYADSVVPKHDRYNDIYYAIVSGKHAELIVRECASLFEDDLRPMGDFTERACRRAIKEHFGVEE